MTDKKDNRKPHQEGYQPIIDNKVNPLPGKPPKVVDAVVRPPSNKSKK